MAYQPGTTSKAPWSQTEDPILLEEIAERDGNKLVI